MVLLLFIHLVKLLKFDIQLFHAHSRLDKVFCAIFVVYLVSFPFNVSCKRIILLFSVTEAYIDFEV